MGHYPCCCDGTACNACDCFPCGVRFKLSEVPGFLCSSSYLTDDLFSTDWVYANVTETSGTSCKAVYETTVGTQPDIQVPPVSYPAVPPFTCGTCVVSPNIMKVRVEITISGMSNCQPPCPDSDFGGSSVCQFCGFQYDVDIYVEPIITGLVSQDHEKWNAIGYQEIGPDRCDAYIAEATSRGFAICPPDPATTYKLQHLNLELCSSGPILDFSNATVTLQPVKDERNYLGDDCDGVTAGCACWWQFDPVSPQTPPCTPTTDPSFVNCIDATFGSSWQNTDWDEDGTIPSTDGWWFTGLDCTDLNNLTLKATDDTAGDFVPCFWSHNFVFDNGPDRLVVETFLDVYEADDILLGNSGTCWDSKTPAYSCTAINSWIQEDVALATFARNKFSLRMNFYIGNVVTGPLGSSYPGFARFEWLSQNDFALSDIWTNGAVAANPLKPFKAWANFSFSNIPWNRTCFTTGYTMAMCIFTAPGAISFPTIRAEEMHCKSLHTIPDVTISPVVCPP